MIVGTIVARVLHVLAVVVWIGGVAFVTLVVLPARTFDEPLERLRLFQTVERRFAWIARGMTVLVALSGFYMIRSLDAWSRFGDAAYWWMHAMVAIWAVFTIILFVVEPLLHGRIEIGMRSDPERAFRRMLILHRVLLVASLVTIAGAVAGAHGYYGW